MEIGAEINQKKFRNDEHKLAVNIIYTFNWLDGLQSSFLKPFGISAQQFNVLRILRGAHPAPVSVKIIRERMLDKMSDASRIVEKLRVKQYCERKICDNDRRSCEVTISQKGLHLLQSIDEKMKSFDKNFSTLSESEIKHLNTLLDKLRG